MPEEHEVFLPTRNLHVVEAAVWVAA